MNIKLFVMDVDGVLSDGIYIGENVSTGGKIEFKRFSPKDGQAIKMMADAGIEVAIISARRSQAVEQRARELKIAHVYLGVEDKRHKLNQLMAELNVSKDETAYVGDDFGDLRAMQIAGIPVAPADAAAEAKLIAESNPNGFVTHAPGGHGAVREAIERILRDMGIWTQVIAKWM